MGAGVTHGTTISSNSASFRHLQHLSYRFSSRLVDTDRRAPGVVCCPTQEERVRASLPQAIVAPNNAVRLTSVTVRAKQRVILDDLSFHIPKGVVAGIVGPNGAGKTTAFRLLAGLIGTFSGEAEVLGYALPKNNDHIRSLIDMVPERDGLDDDMRIVDILDHWARLRFPGDRTLQAERIAAVLTQTKLQDRRFDRCGTLSSGLRRRVSIARAMLHQPLVLLLDEVTNGLDIMSRQDFYEWLTTYRLQQADRTILFASHNTAEVARLCNFLVVMQAGRQVFCGPREQLLSEDATAEAIDAAFLALLCRSLR